VTRDHLLSILKADVVEAGPALLGATLVRGNMRARIVEVEAYRSDDPACHAFKGRTTRTEVMFGPPGFAYVYFNYGVHWMLNIVAHEPGDPAALLIRAAEPLAGLDEMRMNRPGTKDQGLLSGPGKLAMAFGITGADNGRNLLPETPSGMFLIPPDEPVAHVRSGLRVGIAQGKWHEVPWRFVDGNAAHWLSRPI